MTMSNHGVTKLIEELGELTQVLAKKLAYWDTDEHPDGGGSLKGRIEDEMGDVTAAIKFASIRLGLDTGKILVRTNDKLALYVKWDSEPEPGVEATAAKPCPNTHPDLRHPFSREKLKCTRSEGHGGSCVTRFYNSWQAAEPSSEPEPKVFSASREILVDAMKAAVYDSMTEDIGDSTAEIAIESFERYIRENSGRLSLLRPDLQHLPTGPAQFTEGHDA